MTKRAIVIAALVASLGCRADEEPTSFVPDPRASLVVVFKAETPQKDINRFVQEHLIVGVLEKQHSHRPGIRAIVKSRVDEHDAYVIGFGAVASESHRSAIADEIRRSEIVLGVFEGVRPDEISLSNDAGGERP